MEVNRKKIIIAVVSLVLILSSLPDAWPSHAMVFLTHSSEELLASLALVTELKMMASAGGASHIPLISGGALGVYDILADVFDYLVLSNALVTAQIIVLNLSQSVLVKAGSILLVTGLFSGRYYTLFLKALLVALMINPGFVLFLNVLDYVSHEARLDLGISLHQELDKTHKNYQAKEKQRRERQASRDAEQLKKAQDKGRDKIGAVKTLEDKVADAVSNTVHAAEEVLRYPLDVIKVAGKELVRLAVNTMVTVIVVFLILPLAYPYLIWSTIKAFFGVQNRHATNLPFGHGIVQSANSPKGSTNIIPNKKMTNEN